ncbi:MFS general substrate transporter [Colletotrichum falcatum]|nr:MFS general substrate transporter [Colletotrichum falcatum]
MADASVDAIAWIGSIQSCLLLVVGVLVGPLYDAGYFRSLTLTGTALYFSARRALATGIATTGSGFGGVVYPLVVQGLLPRRTPGPDAVAAAGAAGKRRRSRRVMLDLSAYRNASFVVLSAAMFFNVFSYTPPIYYLQQYSLAHGLGGRGSSGLAYYLVAILNAGSVLGRVFPAWLAGRFGPINVLLGVCVSVAAVTMCWLAVRTGAGSVAFALAYGFASGGLVSLPPTVVSILVPHLSLHGTWLGMLSTTNALGSLAGPPIAGVLLDKTGSYLGVQLLSGLGMTTMAVLVLLLRVMRIKQGETWVM